MQVSTTYCVGIINVLQIQHSKEQIHDTSYKLHPLDQFLPLCLTPPERWEGQSDTYVGAILSTSFQHSPYSIHHQALQILPSHIP